MNRLMIKRLFSALTLGSILYLSNAYALSDEINKIKGDKYNLYRVQVAKYLPDASLEDIDEKAANCLIKKLASIDINLNKESWKIVLLGEAEIQGERYDIDNIDKYIKALQSNKIDEYHIERKKVFLHENRRHMLFKADGVPECLK